MIEGRAPDPGRVVVVMGVSGVGKTTIGEALAARLGWACVDADDFHPPANVAKMSAGEPLEDADRWPWLDALNQELRRRQGRGESVVVACSALKETYRQRLADGLRRVQLVYLHGDPDLIRDRLAQRRHRYMPAALLGSQLAALEPPVHAIEVDVAADPRACVQSILERLPA